MITATVDIINTAFMPSSSMTRDDRQRRQCERRSRRNRRDRHEVPRVSEMIAGSARQVYSIAPSTTLADAARALEDQNVGLLTICDVKGGLIGVLSDAHVRRALATHGIAALKRDVEEFMVPAQWTASPTNSLDYVMTIMASQKLLHLPVVENGVVIAILDAAAVIRSKLETLSSV